MIHLLGHTPRDRHSSNTPRLRYADPPLPTTLCSKVLWYLRRLARPCFASEHHNLVILDKIHDLLAVPEDGERRPLLILVEDLEALGSTAEGRGEDRLSIR
jgi:hypothetical protein